MSNTTKAAIYARVSTAEQAHGASLAVQQDICARHIAAQGWADAGAFVDEGVSGAKARRPALDALMAGVRAEDIDVVCVAKLDRIGRSMRHLAGLMGELDDRGVALVSVSEAFDSASPAGRLQRNMLGSFAEFEREVIAERMTTGRDALARAGGWPTSAAPYGWRVDTDGRLALHPIEAPVLSAMVERFANQGRSTTEVAKEMNALGHSRRRGGAWDSLSVRETLRDGVDHLAGTFTWRRPGRGHARAPIIIAGPALIDEATQARLVARLAATTNAHASHPERYLLSGRIVSPHGTAMYGYCTSSPLYRCAETFTFAAPPEGRCATCKTVRAETADEAVWGEVLKLLSDPARLAAMAGVNLDNSGERRSKVDDLAALDRRIASLETAGGHKLSVLLASGLDPAVAAETARSLTDQLDTARALRDRVASEIAGRDDRRDRLTRLQELSKGAKRKLRQADFATRRRIVELLDLRVYVEAWDTCATCEGTGWVSRFAPGAAPTGEERTICAKICPTCLRHRALPRLSIEGSVPDADLDTHLDTHPALDALRWPFRLAERDGAHREGA